MGKGEENISPPKWPFKLLRSLINSRYHEEIEGDLEERYQDNLGHFGLKKARRLYVLDTLKMIRFTLMKRKKKDYKLTNTHMLKHNFLITFRHFNKNRSTFFINLVGLTSGLASALLIFLWVNDELQMDQFEEPDSHRHYQVLVNSPSENFTKDFTPFPLSDALEQELPEVDYSFPTVEHRVYQGVISFDDHHFRAFPLFVGEGYFKVFKCDFTAGDKEQALADQNNIVISEKLANALFGSRQEAIAQTISFKGQYYFSGSYKITGVFDSRKDASFTYDVLISYDRFLADRPESNAWDIEGTQTHIVLNQDVHIQRFNEKISNFLKTKMEYTDETMFVQRYADRYLYGKYENGNAVAGRLVNVRMFSLIAVVVLLIACINYMNLSTAQASKRLKEIGVKKAMGVQRKDLIYQYLGESIFLSFISLILAVGFSILLLSPFNKITGKELVINDILIFGLPILGITLLTGLVSSLYPCLYLSNFNPVTALKGKIQSSLGSLWLRKGLIIFQFTISVILVITVVVIYQQMDFVSKFNLGYNQEQLVSFRQEGKLTEDFSAFLHEVKQIPGVTGASYLWGNLGQELSSGSNVQWADQDPADRDIEFHFMEGGFDMAEMMGVELIAGRLHSREFASDSTAVVLNETAAKLTGYEDPIGERIYRDEMLYIIGVVKDFHFQGMHEAIQPFYFTIDSEGENFVVKIESQNRIETLSRLEELHAQFNPGYPFDFRFINDNYQDSYEEEERIATLSKYFSAITITISCLGLLALTAFSSNARFKEIAIRKVLGSSSLQVARLLSKDFILLVFIAIFLAIPIGYYLMKGWLEGFAYRIDLKEIYFIATGIAILSLAWLTIMTQTIKSAKLDVSETLKAE